MFIEPSLIRSNRAPLGAQCDFAPKELKKFQKLNPDYKHLAPNGAKPSARRETIRVTVRKPFAPDGANHPR